MATNKSDSGGPAFPAVEFVDEFAASFREVKRLDQDYGDEYSVIRGAQRFSCKAASPQAARLKLEALAGDELVEMGRTGSAGIRAVQDVHDLSCIRCLRTAMKTVVPAMASYYGWRWAWSSDLRSTYRAEHRGHINLAWARWVEAGQIPDGASGVYVISAKESPFVKIGYATRIFSRVSTLNAQHCPVSLVSLEGAILVNGESGKDVIRRCQYIERSLHDRLAQSRVSGEWFKSTTLEVQAVLATLRGRPPGRFDEW